MNLDGDLVADLQLPCVGRGRGSAQPAKSGEIPASSRTVVPSEGEPGHLVRAGEVPSEDLVRLSPTRRWPPCGSALRRPGHAPVAVSDRTRRLYDFELEPEVRDWLDSLSDSDYKRVDEVCGLLAEKGTELGGPWSDHREGSVWELRIRLRDVAARITYWCTAGGTIVLLTVFRKTRQHDQKQIDRAVRAPRAFAPGLHQRPGGSPPLSLAWM